jgi:hypothetical protein
LEIGRTSYRLTKPMRQWLRLRDAKCTFPACNNHSLDNDADHILAWADGGGTGIANLGQPCPKHHRLKHSTAWRPTEATLDTPPGWTSPTGRAYPSEQQDWEPPHWPEPPPPPQSDQGWPLLPDWPEAEVDQDFPEPPDWLIPPGLSEPPDHPDGIPDFEGSPGPKDVIDPGSFDGRDAFEGAEPQLPTDPWPSWASVTAAYEARASRVTRHRPLPLIQRQGHGHACSRGGSGLDRHFASGGTYGKSHEPQPHARVPAVSGGLNVEAAAVVGNT